MDEENCPKQWRGNETKYQGNAEGIPDSSIPRLLRTVAKHIFQEQMCIATWIGIRSKRHLQHEEATTVQCHGLTVDADFGTLLGRWWLLHEIISKFCSFDFVHQRQVRVRA